MNTKILHAVTTVGAVAGSLIAAYGQFGSAIPTKYVPIGLLIVAIATSIQGGAIAVEKFLAAEGDAPAPLSPAPQGTGTPRIASTVTKATPLIVGVGLLLSLGLGGCASTSGGSTTSTVASDATSVLNTVADVAQELNTGLQVVAPTAEALLALTHNEGDATTLSNAANEAAVVNSATQALSASIQTAINATIGKGPAAQQTAVNAALSPATVAAIIAPVATN